MSAPRLTPPPHKDMKRIHRILLELGWRLDRINGSHHIYLHPERPGQHFTLAGSHKGSPHAVANNLRDIRRLHPTADIPRH